MANRTRQRRFTRHHDEKYDLSTDNLQHKLNRKFNQRRVCHFFTRCVATSFIITAFCYPLYKEDLLMEIISRDARVVTKDSAPMVSSESKFGHHLSAINSQMSQWMNVCRDATVRLRLIGPEIYAFRPFTVDDKYFSQNSHLMDITNKLSTMIPGRYSAEMTLLQCNKNGENFKELSTSATGSNVCVAVTDFDLKGYGETSNKWSWVYSPVCGGSDRQQQRSQNCRASKLQSTEQNFAPKQEDFVFMEVDAMQEPIYQNGLVTLNDGINTLSKPSSLANDDSGILGYFGSLSNYELVCWLGDEDADRYRSAFLKLYPLMKARFQRPFKFKYIKLEDISDPTKYFSQITNETFFKCKIFFISYGINRFVNDVDYGKEVENLLHHVEKSHPDKTFPAWLLTSRSSTSLPDTTTACIDKSGFLGRTPDRIHKFNEELRRLFNGKNETKPRFESRIRLMDNTDITEAFWHVPITNGSLYTNVDYAETQKTAAVAMRCMEKIAEQVKDWRRMNQQGIISGLKRNGTLTPNPKIVPYTWKQ